ncbi:1,4-dihydroxy-2-naphthoate octaprenyltransferase [Magnetospira thiophila]
MLDASAPSPDPQGLALWWQAIRPRTLILALSPVLVGVAVAWVESGRLGWDVALVAMLCAIAIQAGTNLHNDAADGLNGTDSGERLGPPRITERGWASAAQVLNAAHVAFLLAVLGGSYLVWIGGGPIFGIGVASLVAGYAYSAGPWPISRGPFGELFVILFFGIAAVWGTSYLVTGNSSVLALVLGLAVGMPAGAVLLVNNTRDRMGDAKAGRRTLSILIGPGRARGLYMILMSLPFVLVMGLVSVDERLWGGLAALAALPVVGRAMFRFHWSDSGSEYNACLGATARAQALFCLLLCLGLVLPV